MNYEPRWKSWTRNVYLILVFFAFVPFPINFAISVKAFNDGEKQPTAEKNVGYKLRGNTRYISPKEAFWMNFLYVYMIYSIPSTIVLGGILYFGLKIDIFKDDRK